MKKLLLIVFLIPWTVSATENLIITEIQVKGETANQSYIKIYNPNNYSLDLSGFKLRKKSSTGKEYSIRVFPKETLVKAQEYFVWSNSRDDYHLEMKADVYSTASVSSNNSVALFSPRGELIDALAWGEGENQFVLGKIFPFNPSPKEQIQRKKDIFYQNTQDNSEDFKLSLTKDSFLEKAEVSSSILEKESSFPLSQGVSLSLFLAGLSLFLKNSLKHGRT
jgi:hypothetical protein